MTQAEIDLVYGGKLDFGFDGWEPGASGSRSDHSEIGLSDAAKKRQGLHLASRREELGKLVEDAP